MAEALQTLESKINQFFYTPEPRRDYPSQGEVPGNILLNQDNEEVYFKIKRTTQLKKLMDKYCERQQISNPAHVRFLFDGERIIESNTPEQLQMQNGDEIDVVIEQVGGRFY